MKGFDKTKIIAMFVSILIALGVGGLSGFLSMDNMKDYEGFTKPAFSPPGWVFPIVWTILYILMALAAYRIWEQRKQGKNVKKALVLYALQLFLNFCGQLYSSDSDYMDLLLWSY